MPFSPDAKIACFLDGDPDGQRSGGRRCASTIPFLPVSSTGKSLVSHRLLLFHRSRRQEATYVELFGAMRLEGRRQRLIIVKS